MAIQLGVRANPELVDSEPAYRLRFSIYSIGDQPNWNSVLKEGAEALPSYNIADLWLE